MNTMRVSAAVMFLRLLSKLLRRVGAGPQPWHSNVEEPPKLLPSSTVLTLAPDRALSVNTLGLGLISKG